MARLDFAGLAFAALALFTLGSAAVVALARNVIHSTVALLGTLIGVGGLYLLLAADFLAALQLFVYAAGTLVVLLVAALLTVRTGGASSSNAPLPRRTARYAVLLLVGALTTIAIDTVWPVQERSLVPSTAKLGHALLGEYLIPFELASLVLLAAMIGAFTVARREPE
jgi:NAD(P)H-quinone oxidoreductase subunit 6